MHWLSSADDTAPALPAVWLIATQEQPANLPERAELRRSLARKVLARQFSLAEDAVEIGHEPTGRPLIVAPHGAGLHLSLATRSGLVAVALAHQPVGVDVEQVALAGEPPLAVLHPDERSWFESLPAPARPLAFAQLWSAKEAYVKALGTGFARAPESVAVQLDGTERFTVVDKRDGRHASGFIRLTKNGGHETMAAAFITLD
ncbi:4'-phosphopantetheinyl transferase superfamily protein [Bosea vestrisii]|uniref:4'-phosphopantetheinyl transferase family protein n=1 Tax=Bosea vestrisii TaxID=151416 RepID=UPI0024E02E0C|nr:4'-phosphopantetheinyl transferase superfamily protein [Bosea vestrisii]WID95676.1 4'-phosphopantetheinyl transferase superfamily protein [Bosea vestrisii]